MLTCVAKNKTRYPIVVDLQFEFPEAATVRGRSCGVGCGRALTVVVLAPLWCGMAGEASVFQVP